MFQNYGFSQAFQGAPYALPALVQDMGVPHRGRHVLLAEQFLYGPDVGAVFQQVRCERVPERTAGRVSGEGGPSAARGAATAHGCASYGRGLRGIIVSAGQRARRIPALV